MDAASILALAVDEDSDQQEEEIIPAAEDLNLRRVRKGFRFQASRQRSDIYCLLCLGGIYQ